MVTEPSSSSQCLITLQNLLGNQPLSLETAEGPNLVDQLRKCSPGIRGL